MPTYDDCPGCQSSGEHGEIRPAKVDNEALGKRVGNGSQDGRTSPATVYNPYFTGRPRTPVYGSRSGSIDRQEIIRRIKSGEQSQRVASTSPTLESPPLSASNMKQRSPIPLLPAAELHANRPPSRDKQLDNLSSGLEIERPRSALHKGDFRERDSTNAGFHSYGDATKEEQPPSLSTSPVAPWHPSFPAAAFRQAWNERRPLPSQFPAARERPARSRAVSNVSLSSSFTYQPPTSPLVHQSSATDDAEPRRQSRSPDRNRRHTFSPQSLNGFGSGLGYPQSARNHASRAVPSMRRETTFPYQAHQPRRSLNSFSSLPQTPMLGSRRPSMSEASPLQHAPMVGSYEESILRGRMSTTPSKPLNFVAQIGVLGKGDCKPNLRCPPHVTVPFPAVFYSYGSGTKTASNNDQPSPYVGLVDLENTLKPADPAPEKRRHRRNAVASEAPSRASSSDRTAADGSDVKARRRRQKQKRRSGSPKAPPGGSYRIPQQGQLQIVIKNPNKTAVKLFLVPYDLSDMEPGQKTFIRQRSYSAGPIIDMPLTSRKNLGTDRPEAAICASDDPKDRPMLRYLIHLHICCPAKGRYFLYKSVRVVFANRVPDGKEKLRNEIQLPEPKYSVYKPGRDSNVGVTPTATPSAAWRRRSAMEPSLALSREPSWMYENPTAQSYPHNAYSDFAAQPMQPLPFQFSTLPTLDSRPASRSDGMDVESDRSQEMQNAPSTPSPRSRVDMAGGEAPFASAASEDPFVFARDRSRERQGRSESLLSRRLRDLAVRGRVDGGHGV